MFELSVQREFCAAHAIAIGDEREETHGHNWRVTVVVAGDALDQDGLLCDFHLIERHLDHIIGAFNNRDLNRTPPFDRINPTAEHVAKHIAKAMMRELTGNVRIKSVSVTEAPGCTATYMASE